LPGKRIKAPLKVQVILDTTALVADRTLVGNAMRLLLQQSAIERLSVAVPEVVVLEAVNSVREEAQRALAQFDTARSILLRVGAEPPPSPDLASGDIARAYEDRLRRRFASARATVLPIPASSHESLIGRALARRVPFDAKGQAGYRDTLVWETVKAAAQETTEQIAFISANHRDFAEGGPDSSLSPTLRSELSPPQRDGVDSVILVSSVAAFIAAHVEVEPATTDELRTFLRTDTVFNADVGAQIRSALERSILDSTELSFDQDRLDFGPEFEVLSARFRVVPPGVTHVDVSDVRPLVNDTALLEMYAEVDAEVELELASREDAPSAMYRGSLTRADTFTFGVDVEATFDRTQRSVVVTDVLSARAL
jgi:hypothetical protein